MTTLAADLAGIALRNPLLLAAGTAGLLDEMGDALDLSSLGGVVTKSITPLPRDGNDTYRILPHPSPTGSGMLNAIGLANPGVDAFVRDTLPRASSMPCAVIASVAGFSVDDYAGVGARLGAAPGIAAIELNLSCPNVKHGTEFGARPPARPTSSGPCAATPIIPIFVKLSPIVPDAVGIARAVVDAGASGLTIGNTIPAMAIDVQTRRPLLANVTGGLSGPGIHAVSLRTLWEIFNKFGRDLHGPGKHLPLIGLGGVSRWQDAAEFILAGASAVALGTVLFADPRAPRTIARGLEAWMHRQGVGGIGSLVGQLRP